MVKRATSASNQRNPLKLCLCCPAPASLWHHQASHPAAQDAVDGGALSLLAFLQHFVSHLLHIEHEGVQRLLHRLPAAEGERHERTEFIHTTGFHQKHCSTLVTHHKLTWRHCCFGNRCAARTGRRPAGQQQQQCWLAGCTERKRGSVCRCRGGEEREDGRTAERQGERLKHLV